MITTWQQGIAHLRREVWNRIDQRILQSFGWTRTAKGSAMGDTDQVETADVSDSTVGKGQQRPARRLELWGLRGFPVAKVRTFWVRLGSSNVIYLGIAPTKGYGPTDLAEGETAVYSEKVEKALHATKDGDTKLAAAEGRTVQVAGDAERMLLAESLLGQLKDLVDALRGGVAGTTPIVDTSTGAPLPALSGPAGVVYGAIVAEDYLSENATNG